CDRNSLRHFLLLGRGQGEAPEATKVGLRKDNVGRGAKQCESAVPTHIRLQKNRDFASRDREGADQPPAPSRSRLITFRLTPRCGRNSLWPYPCLLKKVRPDEEQDAGGSGYAKETGAECEQRAKRQTIEGECIDSGRQGIFRRGASGSLLGPFCF